MNILQKCLSSGLIIFVIHPWLDFSVAGKKKKLKKYIFKKKKNFLKRNYFGLFDAIFDDYDTQILFFGYKHISWSSRKRVETNARRTRSVGEIFFLLQKRISHFEK